MKSTTLPLPAEGQKRAAVPICKIIFAKKSIFILANLLIASLSFLSARCNILTYCSPFALAFACAVPNELTPAAVIGAAAGYLTAGYEIVPIRYLTALILSVIIKRIAAEKLRQSPLFYGITALLCTALTGIVTALLLDEVEITLLRYTAESFIAGAATVFWSSSILQIKHLKSLSPLKDSESACLLISIFLMILSLSYIQAGAFSLSHILAYLTILLSAYYGKLGGGSLAGIGAGVALGLGHESTFTFASLCVAGLFAGLGANHSRFLSALALETGLIIPLLFSQADAASYIPFAEAGIAALVFFLLPRKLLNKLRFISTRSTGVSVNAVATHAVSRLRYASEALSDVCTDVGKIRDTATQKADTLKSSIYLNTVNKTCNKCGMKYFCWEKQKEDTVRIFKKIEQCLCEGDPLTADSLPEGFSKTCIRNKVLFKNFMLAHTAYHADKLASQKAEDMRAVMSVQFDALSQLLFDLSEDIAQKEILDADKTDALLDLLDYCEATYLSAAVICDKSFRFRVDIRVPHMQKLFEKKEFRDDLESICARSFSPLQVLAYDNCLKLSFCEKPLFCFRSARRQISAAKEDYCGDYIESLNHFKGKACHVLADGMGSGLSAHINASLSARMLAKLLASGFSIGAAIKVVNAALIVKDSDESFSSLDVLLLDSFSGKADFYKAGATCSYVLKSGKVTRVALSSIPVGILENADFAHASLGLKSADRILLISDGVTQGTDDWIAPLLRSEKLNTPEALVNAVCAQALTRRKSKRRDDISAIAVFVDNADAAL